MAVDYYENPIDGNVHRIEESHSGPASYVAEYSLASGMVVHYIRHDNGDISVYGLPDNGQRSTIAIVTKQNNVYISNPNISAARVENNSANELADGIRQLVNSAFPENAEEIVPLQNRQSFDPKYILGLSGLTENNINPRNNRAAADTPKAGDNRDRNVQGNGYAVVSIGDGYFLSKIGPQEKIIENLGIIPESPEDTGHIYYDVANVDDTLEPPVDDSLNEVRGADSKANAELAEKILADGQIDEKEAQEIRAALDRAKEATEKQRESGVGILNTDKPHRTTRGNTLFVQGNGYRIAHGDDYATIQKIDANGTVTQTLTILPESNSNEGAIKYDDPGVVNALEPFVFDEENNVARSNSKANIALIGKILKDGVIDAKEAKEIGAALERGRVATEAELKKTGKGI